MEKNAVRPKGPEDRNGDELESLAAVVIFCRVYGLECQEARRAHCGRAIPRFEPTPQGMGWVDGLKGPWSKPFFPDKCSCREQPSNEPFSLEGMGPFDEIEFEFAVTPD